MHLLNSRPAGPAAPACISAQIAESWIKQATRILACIHTTPLQGLCTIPCSAIASAFADKAGGASAAYPPDVHAFCASRTLARCSWCCCPAGRRLWPHVLPHTTPEALCQLAGGHKSAGSCCLCCSLVPGPQPHILGQPRQLEPIQVAPAAVHDASRVGAVPVVAPIEPVGDPTGRAAGRHGG
jgi:hypothetical protein